MSAHVRFAPELGHTILYPGDTLLDAALSAMVAIEHECGGNCACTTCQVQIISGMEFLTEMEEVERLRLLDAEETNAQSRLACQAILKSGYSEAHVVAMPVHISDATQ